MSKLLFADGSLRFEAPNIFYVNGCATRIPISFYKKYIGRFRVMSRLLRLEPRAFECLDEYVFMVSFQRGLWIIDSSRKEFRRVWRCRPNFSDPLNICKKGSYIYWGDYGNNPYNESVNIYSYSLSENVKVVYSFAPNTIRHIHNIIWDYDRNGFWILTGDNGKNVGIYFADSNFINVYPVVVGEQRYRAVVGFPAGNGCFIYATDAVNEDNYVNYLKIENNKIEVRQVCSLNGSCIYGTELKDYYIFSTTVEPMEGRGCINLLSNKLGPGIHSSEVHVILVRKKDLTFSIIAKYRKDFLPMKLFQYPTAQFPKGQKNDNILLSYIVACKEWDGKMVKICI